MGDSPQVPTPQNANVTAGTQQNFNTQAGLTSQKASMVNQDNPFGSFSYAQTGTNPDGTPIYQLKTSLNDAQHGLLNQTNATKALAGQNATDVLRSGNYGSANPADVIGNDTKGLTQRAMEQQVAYLKPYQDYQTAALDTKLRNQGFAPGQPGYDMAMKGLTDSQTSSVTQWLSNMEPQMYAQAQSNYLLPATLGKQLSDWGVPTMPSMQQTPGATIQPANYIGAVANEQDAAMKSYNAQLQQQQNMMSGLFGVPTAILGGMGQAGAFNGLLGAAALAT